MALKVPLYIVNARRERLADLVARHGFLPVGELCARLGVSEATARRDLAALEEEKKIKRTYGGAISEYDNRFPSFTERRKHSQASKARIATAGLSFIAPGLTCFFDAGTTVFSIAEAFHDAPVVPLKIVTPSIPVAELLAGIAGSEVYLLAGQLLNRQSVLLGETARKSLAFWKFDLAFLSAEAMDSRGIWNSQRAIVEQQLAVLRRSASSIFCLDGSKLKRRAPHFLVPWKQVDTLLTDVSRPDFQRSGIRIRASQYRFAQ